MDPAFLNIVLKGLGQSFGNLIENIDSNILELIISSMKRCPIDVSDDVLIANAFKFYIYHPWVVNDLTKKNYWIFRAQFIQPISNIFYL